VETIRDAAERYMILPEMRAYWQQATERSRPDWELVETVASAIDPEYRRNNIAQEVMAAIGCCQVAIILVDDILDDDPKGAYRTIGAGKAANLAMAFQSLAMELICKLDLPAERVMPLQSALAQLCLRTAVGQHLDVSEAVWTSDAYWQVVRDKSGPFYAGVMGMGALMLGRPEYLVTFRTIGGLVGEMIQIRDDLMDIMAEPAAPDWAHGGNLLLIYARENEDAAMVADFEKAVTDVLANEAGALERAQQFLLDDGGADYCLCLLREKATAAMDIMKSLAVENHQPIQGVLDKLVNQIEKVLGD